MLCFEGTLSSLAPRKTRRNTDNTEIHSGSDFLRERHHGFLLESAKDKNGTLKKHSRLAVCVNLGKKTTLSRSLSLPGCWLRAVRASCVNQKKYALKAESCLFVSPPPVKVGPFGGHGPDLLRTIWEENPQFQQQVRWYEGVCKMVVALISL